MKVSKEELVTKIEQARIQLNKSIDLRDAYEVIYEHSVALDRLIALYIESGY